MLFFEVTVVKSLEGFAVTGFVARHFVNGVVDCVKVLLFRHARKFGFACGCAVFRRDAKFQILFGLLNSVFCPILPKSSSIPRTTSFA